MELRNEITKINAIIIKPLAFHLKNELNKQKSMQIKIYLANEFVDTSFKLIFINIYLI